MLHYSIFCCVDFYIDTLLPAITVRADIFIFFCVSTNRKVDPGRLVVWTSAVKMVVNILAGFVLRHNSIALVVNAKNKTWQVSRWDQDA